MHIVRILQPIGFRPAQRQLVQIWQIRQVTLESKWLGNSHQSVAQAADYSFENFNRTFPVIPRTETIDQVTGQGSDQQLRRNPGDDLHRRRVEAQILRSISQRTRCKMYEKIHEA